MKYFFQENRYDCGAACVATILSYLVLLRSLKIKRALSELRIS